MIAPMPSEPACVIVTVTVPPGATDRGEIDLLAEGPSTVTSLSPPTSGVLSGPRRNMPENSPSPGVVGAVTVYVKGDGAWKRLNLTVPAAGSLTFTASRLLSS
jgi:hypothetical protein